LRDPRYLHVGLRFQTNVELARAIDAVLDSESFDWMRYSFHNYILWSPSDAETICRKLLRVPGMEGANVFVCALNLNDGFGYLPAWAWEWIRRDRGYGSLAFWTPKDQPGMPEWPPSFPLLPPK